MILTESILVLTFVVVLVVLWVFWVLMSKN